jgi:hypothetical protein
VKVLFYPDLLDFRKSIVFLVGSQISSICPSGESNMYVKMGVELCTNMNQ